MIANIDAWVDWANTLDRITQHWVQPMFSTGLHKLSGVESAQKDFDRALQVLEKHLSSRTYLVGEGLTLADIVVVSHLLLLYITVGMPSHSKINLLVLAWHRCSLTSIAHSCAPCYAKHGAWSGLQS